MTQPVSKTPAVVKRLREGAIWRDDGSEVSPDPTDALLTEAADTIQRLERERDEAREKFKVQYKAASDAINIADDETAKTDAAEARAQLAEDRLKVAREALKPFANFVRSSLWPDDGSEGDETYQLTFNPPGTLGDIKGSDFRCARQALVSTGEA